MYCSLLARKSTVLGGGNVTAGMVNEVPDTVTSATPTWVPLNQLGALLPPLPGWPYTAKSQCVPGNDPVVVTLTAGVWVKLTSIGVWKSRYNNAVPIVVGSAPGAKVPVICENVAHDIVKLNALVALFDPKVALKV